MKLLISFEDPQLTNQGAEPPHPVKTMDTSNQGSYKSKNRLSVNSYYITFNCEITLDTIWSEL